MKIHHIVVSGLLVCLTLSWAEFHGMFKPSTTVAPYVAYFASYYRGTCVGTLVSPSRVLTAAVCVATRNVSEPDVRPITVVLATHYRHKVRGVRIPVVKIYTRWMPHDKANRTYLLQHTIAVLQLEYAPSENFGDYAAMPLEIDFIEAPRFKEECFTVGWNFYTGYPVNNGKFKMQKDLQMQFLTVEHDEDCSERAQHFRSVMESEGYKNVGQHFVCVSDREKKALPCHGMFGAPLICDGKVRAVLSAPDAVHPNCSGSEVLFLPLASNVTRPLVECLQDIFNPSKINFNELYGDSNDHLLSANMSYYYDYDDDQMELDISMESGEVEIPSQKKD